ncbi:SUMO-specific isopeptidase USPL1 isoform X1 [Podarcis raffonei]|uniref:SUMO-specific isopeptidase USPL1 isoform X1 n=1 Tax=Podarcis raffonei TaxID=65483 RepID=UPI0023299839|nr:SUMO-specific isopeptidase USPL1 isoform X1 [Podarcis raffonei]
MVKAILFSAYSPNSQYKSQFMYSIVCSHLYLICYVSLLSDLTLKHINAMKVILPCFDIWPLKNNTFVLCFTSLQDCSSAEVTPDGSCPACKKKGLIRGLRIYHISFEESIFLCENPQCIYPLGFEPLSSIIIPTDKKDSPSQGTCRKRKSSDTSLVTSAVPQHLKLTRTDNLIENEKAFKPDLAPKCNGDNLFGTRSGQPDFPEASQPNFNSATESVEQQMDMKMAAQGSSPEIFSVQAQLLSDPEIGSSLSQILHQDKPSRPEPLWLQWRNVYALCWLDCILSALVHLETLKMILSGSVLENVSVIQSLFAKYNEATALVNTCQRGECVSEVPLDVLSRAESHLNEIRNTIFVQLQPQLKCKLGNKESPVFAFPLLLKKDPQTEKLFLHSYSWKFECSQCGYQVNDRCQKTLTTFTNIIPEWHPLKAVHTGPCNNCHRKSQRREMVLENVSSVLMMHFVEGLPRSDLETYSFQFQGDSYQVTAVVQYQEEARHFITWISDSDETWLECDDLKGSYSRRHKIFGVPPSEIHIVIWERKPPQLTNGLDSQLESEVATNVPLLKAQSNSPFKYADGKAGGNAPLIYHTDDNLNAHTNETQNLIANNKSNLLCGLENLANGDVVTLTLVQVPLDSEGKPLDESPAVENNMTVRTDTSQLHDPGGVKVSPTTSERDVAGKECKLLENGSIPLHQGQPNNASNMLITPVVSLSNSHYSPEMLPVQGAEPEVPIKDSSSLDTANQENKSSRTKAGNSVQIAHSTVEHWREATANSQASAASSPSSYSHSAPKNGTKPFTGSWVKGLLERSHPLMPKSLLTYNNTEICKKPVKKETRFTSLGRQASHFHGFQAKHSKNQREKLTERALDSSHKSAPPSSPTLFARPPIEKHHIVGSKRTVVESAGSLVALGNQIGPKPSHNKTKSFTSAENVEESSVTIAHRLRLQLQQQLKAKKEKLASLDKVAKAQVRNRRSPKKRMKDQSQLQSQKESDSLQSLLNALQHQIDVEDSKSVNSLSTSMSQCSSSSFDDILSELLSPTTSVASLELPQEEECGYGAQEINHDHNYHSPVKENGYEDHTNLSLKSSPKKLDFESPTKQFSLEELLPSSMLNSIMADTQDLHHFDETLLAW